ncbi:MAG: tetratricopeptide repeat protein [Bacteroidia bacterium]
MNRDGSVWHYYYTKGYCLYIECPCHGNAYETLSDFDSAVYFHEKSYQLAVKLKSKSKMIATLANVANCNKLQGNYQAALEKYLLVYRMMESASVYNYHVHYTIADLYLRLGDYQKAANIHASGLIKLNREMMKLPHSACMLH